MNSCAFIDSMIKLAKKGTRLVYCCDTNPPHLLMTSCIELQNITSSFANGGVSVLSGRSHSVTILTNSALPHFFSPWQWVMHHFAVLPPHILSQLHVIPSVITKNDLTPCANVLLFMLSHTQTHYTTERPFTSAPVHSRHWSVNTI